MAFAAVVLDSGVDPMTAMPLRSRAVVSESKRKSNAHIVAPPLIHSTVTPSHKNSQKYDWMPKFYFLRKHIEPKLPPISVFSMSSKNEAGDVDFGHAAKERAFKEDAVDPVTWHNQPKDNQKSAPAIARQLSPASAHHHFPPPTAVKEERASLAFHNKTNGGSRSNSHEDEVFITKRQMNSSFYHDYNVDSAIIYDYSRSHSVDAIPRSCSVDGEREPCSGVVSEDESSYMAVPVNSDVFSDSADAPSSATDAPKPSGPDWKPQEAERILSDIYDLGGACICSEDDGCICCIEDGTTDSPEESVYRKEHANRNAGLPGQNEGYGEIYLDQGSRPGEKSGRNRRRQEETSIDPHFQRSSMHSGVDRLIATTFERRKNTRLSDRIVCKRRFSPNRFETGVDPRGMGLAETVATDTGNNRAFVGNNGGPEKSPRRKETSLYANRYRVAPQSTVLSNVDAAASRSSAVDTLPIAEPCADDLKRCSSAVDRITYANLQHMHVGARTKSSAVDDGASSTHSDINYKPTLNLPVTESVSCDVDDRITYRSSTVDSEIIMQAPFFSTDGLSPATDIEINRKKVSDKLQSESKVVGTEVPIHNKFPDADSLAFDVSATVPDESLDCADPCQTRGDVELSLQSVSVKTRSAPTIADVSNEVPTANTYTMQNTKETYQRVRSPEICKATKVQETTHLSIMASDSEEGVNQNGENDELDTELTTIASELSQETFEESGDFHRISPIMKSAYDLEADNCNRELSVHGGNVKDTTKSPDFFPNLKSTPGKTRTSRIPKPVSTKHADTTDERKKETCGDSLTEPPAVDTAAGNSHDNKSASSTDLTKLSQLSQDDDMQCKPAAEEKSADEVAPSKLKVMSTLDNATKVYTPQVIMFYTHREGKSVTTIPPPVPKPHKTQVRTSPLPNLPPWNTSTVPEKPKKFTKPAPLISKRKSSSQSLVSSASYSSKSNTSNQLLVSSASETSKHILDEAKTSTSIDRIATRLSISASSQKKGPISRQPFRPAGPRVLSEGEKKPLIPAKNSARSHPDLRVPGGPVEIPVLYPSMLSDSSTTFRSTTLKGTKTAQQENNNAVTSHCSQDMYPPETGGNENCNSAVGLRDNSGHLQDFPRFSFSAGELVSVLDEGCRPSLTKEEAEKQEEVGNERSELDNSTYNLTDFKNKTMSFVSSSSWYFPRLSLPSRCPPSKIPVLYNYKESAGSTVRTLGTIRTGGSHLSHIYMTQPWSPDTRYLSSFPAQFQPSVTSCRTRGLTNHGRMVSESYRELTAKIKRD